MSFDYLQNAATEIEVARWRALFDEDPASALDACRRLVADAAALSRRAEEPGIACRADARERLASWIGELTRMSEALPMPTSVFRSSADAHAVGEVCRMISRQETSCRALYAPQPSFERIAQEAQACRSVWQETAHRLACAKQAVQEKEALYEALCTISEEADAARARWTAFAEEFAAWQRDWFDFCRVRLPRFFGELSLAADLSHAGEKCDVSSVRRLCGELRFAAEKI